MNRLKSMCELEDQIILQDALIKKQREIIDDALKLASFYGHPNNWLGKRFDACEKIVISRADVSLDANNAIICGGRQAREFINKVRG